MSEVSVKYYGLGKNWGYATLKDLEEGFRLGIYEYVIRGTKKGGRSKASFDPINEKGERIPLQVGEIMCVEIVGQLYHSRSHLPELFVKIRDKTAVIKQYKLKTRRYGRGEELSGLKDLYIFMQELDQLGTWEHYDKKQAQEEFLAEVETLKQENLTLKQENEKLRSQLAEKNEE